MEVTPRHFRLLPLVIFNMRRAFLTFLALLGGLAVGLPAFAAAVSPATLELSGRRGESVQAEVTVLNASAQPETFFLTMMRAVPRDETGEPRFLPADPSHPGLPEWIAAPASVSVPAQSRVSVPFIVAIPNDIPSGGYYAALMLSPAPRAAVLGSGASIEANVAVLVLLTVEGETMQRLALLDFTSPLRGALVSTIHGPFAWRVQNQGNVHMAPTGTVTVRDVFCPPIIVRHLH